jgi:hypothetical protein
VRTRTRTGSGIVRSSRGGKRFGAEVESLVAQAGNVEAYAISRCGAWVAFLARARFDYLTELYLTRLDKR